MLTFRVQAFVDPGGQCVIVTAASGEAPYELKIWLYQTPKVCTYG